MKAHKQPLACANYGTKCEVSKSFTACRGQSGSLGAEDGVFLVRLGSQELQYRKQDGVDLGFLVTNAEFNSGQLRKMR